MALSTLGCGCVGVWVCGYVGGGRGGDSVVCKFLNWDAENVFHDTCTSSLSVSC